MMKGFVILSLPLLTAGLILHAQNVNVLDKDQDSDWGPNVQLARNENRFEIKLATFDLNMGTTHPFEAVNDAVEGGISTCSFQSQMRFRGVGIFKGSISEIPATNEDGSQKLVTGHEGFCNAQAPGWGRTAEFADLGNNKTDGMIIWALNANKVGLPTYKIEIITKGSKHCDANSTETIGDYSEPEFANCKKGIYVGHISIFPGGGFSKRFVPWLEFKCTWRGAEVDWCPPIQSELSQITNIGIGTVGMGIRVADTNNTEFFLRIRHISARKVMDGPNSAEEAEPPAESATVAPADLPPLTPTASAFLPNMAKMANMWAWPTQR